MKKASEFDKFDLTMRELLKVPHAEIKKKLEEERAKKKGKRKKAAGGKDKITSL